MHRSIIRFRKTGHVTEYKAAFGRLSVLMESNVQIICEKFLFVTPYPGEELSLIHI